jgi:hypothetical protein
VYFNIADKPSPVGGTQNAVVRASAEKVLFLYDSDDDLIKFLMIFI